MDAIKSTAGMAEEEKDEKLAELEVELEGIGGRRGYQDAR